jgi:hypothetical protein
MADATSKDQAAKERIIKHLNADHQHTLSYYLRHYAQLSSRAARAPTLTDISFSAMTFRTRNGQTHMVPFNPPMKSWSEARTRTVEMDRVSRAALDISDIRITEYERPQSFFQFFVLAGCLLAFTVFSTMHMIVPGTFVYDRVLPWFPGGPEWFLWLVNAIALPVVAIHLAEAWWLDRSRLRKHGVERGTALWWKWICSCFMEGRGCFVRIDATVKRKRAEADKAKH